QVSVFSDLNQLRDISLDRDFAGICGITLSELTGTFEPELQRLAQDNNMSYDEALAETQKRYNGYHFSRDSEGVFNPFSILNTFASRDFRYYWFQTGTPHLFDTAPAAGRF
ncbi:MAG: AAA family ATPase, partial [Spirochaetaceae bacterium]|nr:AAA family ATPase [Spirochaetaceae bacterium]